MYDFSPPPDIEFFQTFSRETTLMNGMTSSIGSVSGLQPHEWTSSSPAEKMATSGHTRGSSGDGQLINLGEPAMKRTQSNSSLSDHSRCSISVFFYKLCSKRERHSTECCVASNIIKICNYLPNPSICTMALGSTQPLTEMITRNPPGGVKGNRCVGLTTLLPSVS
jgi:hypothetical protein